MIHSFLSNELLGGPYLHAESPRITSLPELEKHL
jgi:hypothetical protein